MRKTLPLLPLLLAAAACGAPDRETRQTSQDLKTFDSTETSSEPTSAPPAPPPVAVDSRAIRMPSIGPTAAPGVAFNYQYAFRLPAARIGAVQEQHAQACEKLGVEHCRITGMVYQLTGKDDVEAQLAFKLDPALARRFGREGIDAVVRAEGLLTRAQITGEDVGSEIQAAARSQAQIEDDLRRIEQQLARTGLRAGERVELQQQAQQLRDSLRAGQSQQTARRAQLATTPMVFNYEAGETDETLARSMRRALENFLTSMTALLTVLVFLLPWALLALIGYALWRRFRPARAPRQPRFVAEEEALTPREE